MADGDPTPLGTNIKDVDATFFQGAKSDTEPGAVPLGYYWMAVNMINVGGLLSCRPGYRCIVKLPRGNLQGLAIFRPQEGLEQLVMAVDGVIYVSEYPFTEFRQISNLLFSSHARQLYFKMTVQSANRLTDDFASAIEVIEPRAVMIIQDGGETAPGFYDGSNSGHIRNKPFETPVGGAMEWVGDRLWVANGHKVLASDIGNPFSFRETIYLGGLDAFYFTSEVTAMVRTPSVESPQLMIFTQTDASIIEASHRNRDDWPNLENFQKEIIQVGCESSRAVVSHFGNVVWFSAQGLVAFDPAQAGKITARLPVRDSEMLVSKDILDDNLSGVAMIAFGQYILASVPAGDRYNKHTWVFNHASFETVKDDSGPSWAGYWLGTRPVEWVAGDIAGISRIFHVSVDEDGENRLWEAFTSDRLDNECPITWAVFTRGYFGQTSGQKNVGSKAKMAWADVALLGIEEDLDLGVWYAGGTRGAFKNILAKRINVSKGSFHEGQQITATTKLFAFKAQSRIERTQDANQQEAAEDTGSCPVESEDLEHIDDNFQLLIVGQGPAGIRYTRCWAYPVAEDLHGEPEACVDETPFNSVRYDGAGAMDSSLELTITDLEARPDGKFTSIMTRVVEQEGFTAVGIAQAESIISQNAADRVAFRIATKQAEAELRMVLPKTISVGEGWDE